MESNHASDEALMARTARDDREALALLLRRYATPLLTFLQRMVGNRHRAEELFQEVFLAVWKQRRQYAHSRAFRPWLFGIAANQCRADYRRRPGRTSPSDEAERPILAAGPSPVEAAIATETACLVAGAVAALPEGQRTVVVLRVYNGLSYREIAESLQRTEATVRSHMFHALAALRHSLERRLR
jgi:RNA polymerase sigma-70 factor (ECF subfamily)